MVKRNQEKEDVTQNKTLNFATTVTQNYSPEPHCSTTLQKDRLGTTVDCRISCLKLLNIM